MRFTKYPFNPAMLALAAKHNVDAEAYFSNKKNLELICEKLKEAEQFNCQLQKAREIDTETAMQPMAV